MSVLQHVRQWLFCMSVLGSENRRVGTSIDELGYTSASLMMEGGPSRDAYLGQAGVAACFPGILRDSRQMLAESFCSHHLQVELWPVSEVISMHTSF